MVLQTEQQVDVNAKPSDETKVMGPGGSSAGSGYGRKRTGKRLYLCGFLVLVVVCLVFGWCFLGHKALFDENKNINTNEFQAIFLTNGQVYFGKLADLNHKYVTIKDIYYLQVQQNSNLQGASGSTTPNSQVSLAKLGNELHGPEDKMYIANDQMLFWENLKGTSKVVQAIDKYQAQH